MKVLKIKEWIKRKKEALYEVDYNGDFIPYATRFKDGQTFTLGEELTPNYSKVVDGFCSDKIHIDVYIETPTGYCIKKININDL